MEPKKTVEDFFDKLPDEDKQEADIFGKEEAEKKPEIAAKEEVVPEKEEAHKNRRHRRLEQQLEEERERRIAAEAREEARSESQRFSQENGSDDVDERWLEIYGDTPATRRAWKLQQEIFADQASRIKESTLQEIEQEQYQARQEQAKYEQFIDSQLEALEDEHNIDLTSDAPQARKARRELLETVEKLSPKDEDGAVTSFADFGGAYEMYSLRQSREKSSQTASRQKELGSRSMERSGNSAPVEREVTPGFRGWERDMQRGDFK